MAVETGFSRWSVPAAKRRPELGDPASRRCAVAPKGGSACPEQRSRDVHAFLVDACPPRGSEGHAIAFLRTLKATAWPTLQGICRLEQATPRALSENTNRNECLSTPFWGRFAFVAAEQHRPPATVFGGAKKWAPVRWTVP
jgi:hypothetical protein